MMLRPYVDQLAGGIAGLVAPEPDAERIAAAIEPAVRLALLDALSAGADEITREIAPGSVEVRLRAGEPEFVVATAAELSSLPAAPPIVREPDDPATARINLRLPESLKAAVEQAANAERLSVNTWLVRAAEAAVARDTAGERRRGGRIGETYKGWAR